MTINYRYTTGRRARARPIIDFLSRLFPELNQELWDWEYNKPPKNSSIVTASHNGCLVGHYACINYNFVVNGEVVEGSKAEGSLVNLRKIARLSKRVSRGVFTKLVRELLKNKSNENCAIIFGFSNNLALPGQLEAGFKLIEIPIRPAVFVRDLSLFLRPSNLFSKCVVLTLNKFLLIIQFALQIDLSKRKFVIRNFTNIAPEEIDRFADKFNLSHSDQITIHRDAEFYRWRFVENPYHASKVLVAMNASGEIQGVCAFCQNKENIDTLQIQDLIAINRGAIRALLKAGICLANSKKTKGIEIWSGQSFAHQIVNTELKKLGFIFGKQQRKKMIVWSKSYQSSVTDPLKWYVTMAFRRH